MRKRADVYIAICSAAFILVLAVAAYWDSTIRVLHVFESLPYIAAAVLCLRHQKFGYALGVVSGAFWLWTAGFLTTFIRNGFERAALLIRSGTLDRADILIAVPAAIASAGLVVFSIKGYADLARKSASDFFLLFAALLLVPAFFIGIFAAFAPQYLGMFHGILGRLGR
jgi:hypothetical protein